MSRLVSAITGNPALLLWIALACLTFGAVSGTGAAWYIQGLRIDTVQAEFDGFRQTVKAEGEAAKKLAAAQAAEDKRKKESSDHDYKIAIANLTADNKRLRDARARSSFLPASPAGSGRADLACFDRAELEQALRRLDDGISSLLEEGDTNAVGLNAGRLWARGIGSGMSLHSPATSGP